MRPRRLAQALFLFVIPALIVGQAPDDSKVRQARFTALLEETIGQIRDLRLPENRAFSYAQAGRILWDLDQKRAVSAFESAGSELAAAVDAAATRQKPGRYYDPNQNTQFRQPILNTIAEKDAALALAIFYRTRPAAVARAMSPQDPRDVRISNTQNNSLYIAQNENYLESSLYRMAAQQDSANAVPILKAALARPLSQSTFEQLTQLAEKDPVAAKEAGNDVIKRLVGINLMRENQPDYQMISLANQIVSHYMATSAPIDNDLVAKLRFDPGSVQDLVNKLIKTFLTNQNSRPYIPASTVMTYAQKLSPGFVEELKQFNVEQPNNANPVDTQFSKLMQADTTPDQMLTGAGKLPVNYRSQVYSAASNKMLNQGNSAAARSVLEENFTDDARDQALANFDQQLAYKLMGESKFSDTEAVINGMPENYRIGMLVELANRVYSADKDQNRVHALIILENARNMVGDHPSDSEEMGQLMQIAGALAQIDASRSMDILERLIPQINDLSEACAVLWGFQDHNAVRDGEFVMAQGGGLAQLNINTNVFGQFANADLDRTTRLIDSFSRPEIRVALRLQMLSNGHARINSLPVSGRGRMVIFN